MQNIYNEVNNFLGIKDDEDIKEIDPKYFWKVKNFNFQSIGLSGMEKITMPKRISYIADIPNGINWDYKLLDDTASGGLANVKSIIWDGQRYILLQRAGIHTYFLKYSYNGNDWITIKKFENSDKILSSLAYGNGVYVICGQDLTGGYNSILYSKDAFKWTEIAAPYTTYFSKIRFVNNKFFIFGNANSYTNNIIYSDDGINWDTISTGLSMNYEDIIYANNMYTIVGRSGSNGKGQIIYSIDLITWYIVLNVSVSEIRILYGITFGNNLYIACGGSAIGGALYTSKDGIVWTDMSDNIINAMWDVAVYGDGIYILGANSSTTSPAPPPYKTIAYSYDGYTWNYIDTSEYYPLTSILYANRTFLLGGNLYSSPNAVVITNGNNGHSMVDGMFEYRFLDDNNILQKEQIGICNGSVYKNILSIPVLIADFLTKGKCSFAVLNDKLYIANGKDYVWKYDGIKGVITQMGSPTAIKDGLGILNGNYYYAITNVLAGGEEYVGSVSNTLSLTNNKVLLDLPLGNTETLSRKIYRTESNGTILKLLATIVDNTTLTYSDNVDDASLGAQIININNELPKPYFLGVFQERLVGSKVDLYPTQIFITEVEKDYFDSANGLDIANYSDDNSPVNGMGIDFSSLMVGTLKHWYIISIDSSNNIAVQTTRVNIGVKDGYSVVRIPTYGNFSGGLMFVSTNNDVRVLNGLRAITITTSVDNISSDIFSQNVMGSLGLALNGYSNIYAEYFDYKYHLIVDGNKYVYDIRLNGWTYHEIQSENYKSSPTILAIFDNILYNGQEDGWIEQEYFDVKYRDEEVPATLESVQLNVSKDYSAFQKLVFWLSPTESNKMDITVIADDNIYLAENSEFDFIGGAFDDTDYITPDYYIAGETDFRTYNIHKNVRWLRWILNVNEGNIILRKWGMYLQTMTGKE